MLFAFEFWIHLEFVYKNYQNLGVEELPKVYDVVVRSSHGVEQNVASGDGDPPEEYEEATDDSSDESD